MRRVQYQRSGGPEVLEVVSAEVPTPGPGELLVRVEAVGVTLPVVRKVREVREPIALGGEIAGEVVAVGDGVTSCMPGYRVTGLVFGHGYADYALLSSAMASPIPDGASAVDAVALVRSGLVAARRARRRQPEAGRVGADHGRRQRCRPPRPAIGTGARGRTCRGRGLRSRQSGLPA